MRHPFISLLALIAGCSAAACTPSPSGVSEPSATAPTGEPGRFKVDVWADNWFAMYLGDQLIQEDSVSITTERSFNSESFSFEGSYPLHLNFVIKDFKQDDTGLEYIGKPNQQMGDGGFIAQIADSQSGALVAVSNSSWRCLVIHQAPLDKSCEKDSNPTETCKSSVKEEPAGWKAADFDSSAWPQATEYSAAQVGPKDGYDRISWDDSARLIWTSDLETDNTLLCKLTVEAP